ncbi:transposase InsD for insertion element IS2A/D/F/H/I/K [Escherichia coli B921]|nr:transposase InsD for insertion element IS2A/D/F/H/I/K [Escherichia coli B921]
MMVCLRSMPNVFTGSCARMRCCLSEKPLYRHRNGHILAKWP